MAGGGHEQAVARVKDIQRTDPTGKQAWWNYADKCGGGAGRDPAKHEEQMLQNFLSNYDAGGFADVQVETENAGSLGDAFKECQRSSRPFKDAWANFNQMQGNRMNDPTKASKDTLVAFLDMLGKQAMGGMMMGGGMMMMGGKGGMMMGGKGGKGPMMAKGGGGYGGKGGGYGGGCDWGGNGGGGCDWGNMGMMMMGGKGGKGGGGPPMKKQKVSTGDPMKDSLVEKVKSFQRSSEDNKQAWWSFCDGQESQNRDPARYEIDTLQMFLQGYGI